VVTAAPPETLELRGEDDVVRARQLVRQAARDLRFSLVDETKVVTAASEIARNAVIYGGGGRLELIRRHNGVRRGLELIVSDQGPGIADVSLAMRDGYTTGNGLGLGLGGARRLVHDFSIESRPGEGTRVTLLRWT
jgi:serine/threonine-protein kinase RsbT